MSNFFLSILYPLLHTVEQVEFAESKASADGNTANNTANSNAPTDTSFMDIPDSIDEELPFN